MKIRILDLRSIPNVEGFEFTGIVNSGEVYPDMKVLKNEFGQYYVVGYNKLLGWIGKNENQILTK